MNIVVPSNPPSPTSIYSCIQTPQMNFTISSATPPGRYLMRVEHLNLENGNMYKGSQIFLNCAHIEVMGTVQVHLDR